jgi:hypothetical protein
MSARLGFPYEVPTGAIIRSRMRRSGQTDVRSFCAATSGAGPMWSFLPSGALTVTVRLLDSQSNDMRGGHSRNSWGRSVSDTKGIYGSSG